MMGWLLGLKWKLYAGIGIAIGVVAVLFKVFFMGKSAARVDDMGRALRRAKKAREAENEVATISDRDLRDRLRDNGWLRHQ